MQVNISNLSKSYGGKTVLKIDELNLNHQEITGFVGNNGAGKTTFFKSLLNLIKSDSGTIELIQGQSRIAPFKTEEWKKFTGAYLDDSFLIDFLTPKEFFEFIGKINQMNKEEVGEFLEQIKTFTHDDILDEKKLIRNLSAGNRQKMGIAAAMMGRPKLLVLDEPFNFLDPSSQNRLKQMLVNYQRQNEATVFISSHNLQHTIDISQRIILLENGKIVKDLNNQSQSAEKELEQYFNI